MTSISSLTTSTATNTNSSTSSTSATSPSSSSVTIQEINSLIGYTNTNSVSGLVSGINTDSIVAQMMESEAEPLIKLEQTQQTMEWQRDGYRSMNTLLQTLQTNVQTMQLQGTFLQNTVNSSNSSVATATAGPTAGNTSYTLSNVSMATSASINGGKIASSGFDPTKSLWSQASNLTNGVSWTANAVTGEATNVLTAGSTFQLKNAYVDSSQNTSVSIADGSGNTTATYSTAAGNLFFGTSAASNVAAGTAYINTTTGQITFGSQIAQGSTITANYSYDTANLSIATYDSNGNALPAQNFSFSPNTSLNDMLTQITQSNAGVSAFFDSTTGTVSMTRTDTGQLSPSGGQAINASGSAQSIDFFNNTLGLGTGSSGATYVAGSNAQFTINGLATSRASNTFTIGGTTISLQGNTTGSVTLNVTNDTNSVTTAINNFISTYNSTISQINSTIDQTPNPNYPPLSSIQQSQMSDTDIANWNAQAQQGLLSNDSILSGALSQMRQDLYAPVSGTSDSNMQQLAQIGITVSTDYTQHGALVVSNPTLLQQAISSDPQGVMELFTNQSTDPASQGIMQRLSTTITNTMNQVEQKAGNTSMADAQYFLGQNIDNLNTQIAAEKTKLSDVETRYYSQFDAMEQAIQQANAQSSYLQSFASSNG
ncbi:flagellar filament capping protein FliD [Sporolactobacillus pectinivorans]|uniref:flagellar filament capping protein FliD n=1 Tax=Sporolactobacillus pectinivorans TaxID=1591408 RepID=UPI000C25D86F|nr:flagellar filament capping protein FliD [Sporolactobacillus pectinivorans]